MTFNSWLKTKCEKLKRLKFLFMLSEDMLSDKAFPKEITNAVYLRTYLEGNNASEEYIKHALELFAQYTKEIKARHDSLTLTMPPLSDSISDLLLDNNDD